MTFLQKTISPCPFENLNLRKLRQGWQSGVFNGLQEILGILADGMDQGSDLL
jgi:hypothetical protein